MLVGKKPCRRKSKDLFEKLYVLMECGLFIYIYIHIHKSFDFCSLKANTVATKYQKILNPPN